MINNNAALRPQVRRSVLFLFSFGLVRLAHQTIDKRTRVKRRRGELKRKTRKTPADTAT